MSKINNYLFECDEARFSIVLYNLISNSVKHTIGG
jgi:signal transduction histidine kinase